jgi:tetratricopeptide (TPR) repeat protein
LAFSADPAQPVLLASDLQSEPAGRGAQVFRGAESASRAPQATGAIISIEDGVATINLGSLDGVAKGSELQLFRDGQSTQPVGRLVATTVFRERARGRIIAGEEIQVGHQVRVSGVVHLGALMEQVDALSSQGDAEAARKTAEKAVAWAESASVLSGQKRKALQRLAALEYQAGALQAAESHYRSAVESLNAQPPASSLERSAAWNSLAVLHMLRGDYDGAEAALAQAVSASPKTDIAYGRSANNLGVLAELRGDRRKAEAHYADALHAFGGAADSPAHERRVVETNLTRIKGLR